MRNAIILASALAFAALPAAAEPLFGPATYERTTGQTDVYEETFGAPSGGPYSLWVHSGDDGGHGVTNARISINGVEVVDVQDLASGKDVIVKRVGLLPGDNAMTVTLNGEPGSYISLVILPLGEVPFGTVGRLLVPYASAEGLVIDLKNGSHQGTRHCRLVFYDASGAAVAASERLELAPRASVSQLASGFVATGAWDAGSIEIFYAGAGLGRLFGQASEKDLISGVSSIVPIVHAGTRIFPARRNKP